MKKSASLTFERFRALATLLESYELLRRSGNIPIWPFMEEARPDIKRALRAEKKRNALDLKAEKKLLEEHAWREGRPDEKP